MSEKIKKQIEDIFKEIYDLKIEYRVLGDIVITAITNIATCKFDGNDEAVEAWTAIRYGYEDRRKIISTRINDLQTEALQLKEKYFEEKEKEAQ